MANTEIKKLDNSTYQVTRGSEVSNVFKIKKLDNGMYQATCDSEVSNVFKCYSTAEYWLDLHRK